LHFYDSYPTLFQSESLSLSPVIQGMTLSYYNPDQTETILWTVQFPKPIPENILEIVSIIAYLLSFSAEEPYIFFRSKTNILHYSIYSDICFVSSGSDLIAYSLHLKYLSLVILSCQFCFVLFFQVLGTELKALHILGKYSTTWAVLAGLELAILLPQLPE
jgi:hypothetical protein